MKFKVAVFSYLLIEIFTPSLSLADTPSELVGKIFPLGKTDGAPWFTQKTRYSKDGDGRLTADSTIVDQQGKLVLTEKVVLQGSKLITQKVEQLQTGYEYTVVPKADKVLFQILETKGKGNKEEDSVELTDNFITGPTTQPYLAEHWQELLDGKTVHCRFGVLESKDTFGFNFKLKRKEILNGKELIVVSMKPSSFFNSFFFSLLEDGIEIYMDPITKRYVRYKGLTPLFRVDEQGKLHHFTAEIIYE